MRVVAVFSGGGAKCLAHLGAWRALGEAGLTPTHIVATSMGAVLGAALAAGLSPEDVAGRMRGLKRSDVAPVSALRLAKGFFADSLFAPDALRRTIAHLVPAARFENLTIPLTVCVTDADTGELVLFSHPAPRIPLLDCLYASCALPLYYPPAEIAGRHYVDGGLRAVLPLAPAQGIPADLVVAVHVGPGFDEQPPPSSTNLHRRLPPPLVRAHGEAIRIMMAAQAERAIADWPADGPRLVLVRAVAEREATFRVEDAERYLAAGYEATQGALVG